MNTDFVKTVFEYQMSEDRRLWNDVIMSLDESMFSEDTDYSWGTLQRECVHVVDIMHECLQRIDGIQQVSAAFTINDPDRSQVRQTWDAVEANWLSYIAGLNVYEFQREVKVTYRDQSVTVPVWAQIFHVCNHNTLHRLEILQMVAVLRGAIDFDMSFAAHCLHKVDT